MPANKIVIIFSLLFCLGNVETFAQSSLTTTLSESYNRFKETSLKIQRIKHTNLQPLIDDLDPDLFRVHVVGHSIEGRSISMISVGKGKTQVLLWSQMHGDEPTATMALFDIFHFLKDNSVLAQQKTQLLNELTIHFIPMLNPDGAERFRRRNALQVDINRDALRLQSPEAQLLKRVRDSLKADFGFNLHDQSTYYNAKMTPNQATISLLAPAFNYPKDINDVRIRAMQVIVLMNKVLQELAPGHVARYEDDFYPRAFGDNITKWGTSTILIESGGYPGDPEKQFIRKLNYVAILASLFSISDNSYKKEDYHAYEKIPPNDNMLFDLLIRGMSFHLKDSTYLLDIGIDRSEIDNPGHTSFHYKGSINDIGDLSTNYGYKTLKADGLTYHAAKIYPDVISDTRQLNKLDFYEILAKGYGYIRMGKMPASNEKVYIPINLVSSSFENNTEFGTGEPATFFLESGGKIRYAVINGFLYDLNSTPSNDEYIHGLIEKE